MRKLALCWVFAVFAPVLLATTAGHPPGFAIASASPEATNAGMAILNNGGNAFDAAVAVASSLGVTEPYSSGLGGGGFFLLHDEAQHKDVFIDAREVAPKAATADMFLNKQGQPDQQLSLSSPLSSAIPGLPAALDYIANHYGSRTLAVLLAPAIKYADQGFIVNENYRDASLNPKVRPALLKYPSSFNVLLGGHKQVQVGQRIVQHDLAKTLQLIAKQGRDGFYRGRLATKLVKGVQAEGGIWQLSDLKDYRVKVREPLRTKVGDVTVVTAPPPSAGGIAIITMFNLFDHFKDQAKTPIDRIHYVIESMRMAYWDRVKYLGDPDFVDIPMKTLLSQSHVDALAKFIRADKATPSSSLPDPEVLLKDGGPNTTHFSIIDRQGNRVSATLSINFHFGNGYVVPGTGVLLNNEMDDFASKPGGQNGFGLVGGNGNVIAPGKRPLSSMSPTFLVSSSQVAMLGSTGGSRIPTAVFLSSLAFTEGETPMTFVTQPRYHHQYLPDVVTFEMDAFNTKEQIALRKMGYHLQPVHTNYGARALYYGNMQGVGWLKDLDMLVAVSDPRYSGEGEVNELLDIQ